MGDRIRHYDPVVIANMKSVCPDFDDEYDNRKRELWVEIYKHMEKLDTIERGIVCMVSEWGKSYRQIERAFGLSKSDVHRRYKDAIRKLKHFVETEAKEKESGGRISTSAITAAITSIVDYKEIKIIVETEIQGVLF